MKSKKYLQLCFTTKKNMTTNSIFQRSWWLDALAPNTWEEVKIEKNGEIVARLPYIVKKKMGLTILTKPALTQTLGPWIVSSTAKYSKQIGQQKELFTELIQKLPPHDYFNQSFHYSIANWQPFYWQGYTIKACCTYVIEDLTDLDQVWSGFQENIRREIRKAEKQVTVRSDLSLDRFLDLNDLTFRRQGEKAPYTREFVYGLDRACVEHQARKMFFAEDAQGRIHAALYMIWDENSAYYLMGGADPELRNSGASSLLMWEAIQFAATVTKKFDFEGSSMEPIERFVRSFGGKQVQFYNVTKISTKRMKLLMLGQELMKVWS
jgi:lipid II:glycine glycyltransferase (peptidoglycan interpeptide bridge formation enzyme)